MTRSILTAAKQASIRPESSKQRKTEKKVLEAFEPRGQIFGSSRGRTISSKETDDRQPTKKGRTGLQSYAYMRIGKKSSQGRGAKRVSTFLSYTLTTCVILACVVCSTLPRLSDSLEKRKGDAESTLILYKGKETDDIMKSAMV